MLEEKLIVLPADEWRPCGCFDNEDIVNPNVRNLWNLVSEGHERQDDGDDGGQE